MFPRAFTATSGIKKYRLTVACTVLNSKDGNMKPSMLTPLFTALIALALQGCSNSASTAAIERKVLLQSSASWDSTPYTHYPYAEPQLSVLKLKIPANTQLPWHRHAMPNAAYVLSGELTIESKESGQVRRVKQGEAVAEMVNITHRGVTGEEPVELIVFYAGSEGIPLSE
jgi:quercetin dioxygenase-like cupin family protein